MADPEAPTGSPLRLVLFTSTIVLSVLCALAIAAATTVRADIKRPAPSVFITPTDVNSGSLLIPSKQEGYFVEAPKLATDVEISITGPIARVKVTQRFENPTEGWVEGVYVFPLPEESAVDSLRMQIGDRFIEGQIKERQQARQIYEQAKVEGRKASLVEQERPNVFTNSVANIGPGETVIAQIEYQETVKRSGDEFRLRFPMVVAPRYNPSPTLHLVRFDEQQKGWGAIMDDPVPDRERIESPVRDPENGKINPITLTVDLQAGFPLGEIISHHHTVALQRDGDGRATLAIDREVPADQDFELSWTAQEGGAPAAALYRERVGDEDYLLVMVTPPAGDVSQAKRDREVIFVIDNSGSMAGESMPQAKASVALALDRLTSNDKFNIVRFDDTHELLFPTPVRADRESIAVARRFVSDLEADGGTEMLPALKASLVDATPRDRTRVRQVIFLTDGAVGNEEQLFEAIDRKLGRSRLFTVGIGSAPNSYFMVQAAQRGRGTFTHIGDLAQVENRMADLFEKLERPVMTDLEAKWPDGSVAESWPNPLPDLYAGEPVLVVARLRDIDGSLNLTGRYAGAPWVVRLPLSAGEVRPGVGKLWARKKIAALESEAWSSYERVDYDAQILETALSHHLVSRNTSLVAVDVTPSRPTDQPLGSAEVELNLPDGWDFDKVYGEKFAPTQRDASRTRLQASAMFATAPTPTASAPGIALPRTATDAPALILSGLLSLLFATVIVALALIWRRIAANWRVA